MLPRGFQSELLGACLEFPELFVHTLILMILQVTSYMVAHHPFTHSFKSRTKKNLISLLFSQSLALYTCVRTHLTLGVWTNKWIMIKWKKLRLTSLLRDQGMGWKITKRIVVRNPQQEWLCGSIWTSRLSPNQRVDIGQDQSIISGHELRNHKKMGEKAVKLVWAGDKQA